MKLFESSRLTESFISLELNLRSPLSSVSPLSGLPKDLFGNGKLSLTDGKLLQDLLHDSGFEQGNEKDNIYSGKFEGKDLKNILNSLEMEAKRIKSKQ